MNQINPQKLAGSKWTASQPLGREKHFQVIKRLPQTPEQCIIEAVVTKSRYHMPWRQLKDQRIWKTGWQ